ncbi:ribosome maturation factor RimM [Bacteroidota bacterium]
MDIDSCFQLGHVTKVHGIKGEVVAYLDVDDPGRYKNLESVLVGTKQGLVPFFVESIRIRDTNATIKFDGVDSIEGAGNLKSCELYLPLDLLPDLDDDQFYFHEIIGFSIIDKNLGKLGEIKNVYDSGAQVLIAINHQGKEILFPLNNDLIIRVNKQEKVMEVDLPEGLVNLYI